MLCQLDFFWFRNSDREIKAIKVIEKLSGWMRICSTYVQSINVIRRLRNIVKLEICIFRNISAVYVEIARFEDCLKNIQLAPDITTVGI